MFFVIFHYTTMMVIGIFSLSLIGVLSSPVSYWDPQHYGHIVTGVEMLAVLVCVGILLRCSTSLLTQWFVGVVGVSYAVFFGYAVWVWI